MFAGGELSEVETKLAAIPSRHAVSERVVSAGSELAVSECADREWSKQRSVDVWEARSRTPPPPWEPHAERRGRGGGRSSQRHHYTQKSQK